MLTGKCKPLGRNRVQKLGNRQILKDLISFFAVFFSALILFITNTALRVDIFLCDPKNQQNNAKKLVFKLDCNDKFKLSAKVLIHDILKKSFKNPF